VNRDEYEAQLAAKRRRMLERPERRDQEAREAAAQAGAIADRIPMGQPILVGHHSERRHRRDLDRIDRNMCKASEAAGEADDLRRRAAKVGSTISAEDPDAADKLEAKLADLEASREAMKAVNDAYRRGGWDAVRVKGLMTEEQIAETRRVARRLGAIPERARRRALRGVPRRAPKGGALPLAPLAPVRTAEGPRSASAPTLARVGSRSRGREGHGARPALAPRDEREDRNGRVRVGPDRDALPVVSTRDRRGTP
jgi:hypothetical protein